MNFSFPKVTVVEKEKRKAFLSYWFRRVFLDDWLMKIVALAITTALWLGVSGLRQPTTRSINNVSLNTLVSKDLEVTNSMMPDVDIEITGDKRAVDEVNGNDLSVRLDLTDLKDGDRTVHLTPQGITVDLPSGVTVTKISPEKIAVKLERVEEALVPVRIETDGEIAEGFEIYSRSALPAKVRVRGPKSFVESLSFVTTEKIDLKCKETGFTALQVPLNISDPKISLVNEVTTTVVIQIGRKRTSMIFGVPYQTETRAGRAKVNLFGPKSLLDDLSPEDLEIIETKTESGQTKLNLVLPSSVKDKVVVKSVEYNE
jgi:YbbR domain-containing protein